jgi:hypothetical protein
MRIPDLANRFQSARFCGEAVVGSVEARVETVADHPSVRTSKRGRNVI